MGNTLPNCTFQLAFARPQLVLTEMVSDTDNVVARYYSDGLRVWRRRASEDAVPSPPSDRADGDDDGNGDSAGDATGTLVSASTPRGRKGGDAIEWKQLLEPVPAGRHHTTGVDRGTVVLVRSMNARHEVHAETVVQASRFLRDQTTKVARDADHARQLAAIDAARCRVMAEFDRLQQMAAVSAHETEHVDSLLCRAGNNYHGRYMATQIRAPDIDRIGELVWQYCDDGVTAQTRYVHFA